MTDTTPTDRYPTGRYPATGGSRRTWLWALVAVGLVAGVLAAFLLYQKFGTPDIESEVVTYTVVDDSTVQVQFTVTRKDPSQEAVCIIRSRSKDGSETGRREVLIPSSESGTLLMDAPVITSQRPGMADMYGCSFDVPEYLRAH
ncbi:DUF4307 domain-containing protein [Rhodococcus indonesiensis]|uniref:DUF4307 domain-containing protein n=1 Tax=Rhodococcus indonesiensis TaxID=3055869 RepID=UPI0039F705C0